MAANGRSGAVCTSTPTSTVPATPRCCAGGGGDTLGGGGGMAGGGVLGGGEAGGTSLAEKSGWTRWRWRLSRRLRAADFPAADRARGHRNLLSDAYGRRDRHGPGPRRMA